ncbi:MAG TPA: hypothetical protein VHR97_11190 [Candidatus Baltobacteraceae bacterium]|jgi:hypothetical protein|nr:hypothetical protein [Candidatus Baltobacteraceae bacterium]
MAEHCAAQPHDSTGRPVGLWPWPFETWEAILDAAVEKGIAAVEVHDKSKPIDEHNLVGFGGMFGPALLKRWRWLQDAKARGLTPTDAEAEFTAAVQEEIRKERERIEQEGRDAARRRRADAKRGRAKQVEDVEF